MPRLLAVAIALQFPIKGIVLAADVTVPDAAHAYSTRRHQGIPSLAASPVNGRLWCTWYGGPTGGEDANNYAVLATSDDGGATWKEVLVADPDGKGPRRAFDPEVWIDADGRLRWVWTERIAPVFKEGQPNNVGCLAPSKNDELWLCALDAEHEPSAACPPSAPRHVARGIMMGKPVTLPTGERLCPVANWGEEESSQFYVTRDGFTFTRLGGTGYPPGTRCYDEHQVVRLANGDLKTFARLGAGRNPVNIGESVSHDNGRTWTPGRPGRIPHTSSHFFVTRLASGNLLLVKHGPLTELTNVRDRLTAYISDDGGETWKGGLLLDARKGVSYPDGQQLPDGRILVAYDYGRTTTLEISFAEFTEADVLVGRDVSGKVRLRRRICGRETPVAAKIRQPLVLAERGKAAAYSIVIPAKAVPAQRYAAEELRDFIEKVTGVKLPIVTDAGGAHALPSKAVVLEVADATGRVPPDGRMATDRTGGTDGFRLKVEGKRLRITGENGRGVLYGVYEVLERFAGCRWYASWHSVIPKRDRIEIPAKLDETQTPAFAMREPYWYDVTQNQEFAARLRVNSRSWKSFDEKYGGNPYRFGGKLGSCHTFEQLLPQDKYFDAHPEYFSMIDGKRVRGKTQPCLTNPDVLRIVTSNVLDRIRQDPGAKFYGVSQEDNCMYCRCPKCKAIDDEEGSPSGTNVRFVNAVAEAVEKEFPDVLIETLAYSYTQKAPAKTKLRHNVVPCLCAISCDFARPIDESPYKANVEFRKDIEDWGRQTDFLFVWDYTTDFAHYPLPWANVYSLQGNLRFFRRNNVKALFALGAWQGRHADFGELKAWLLAKWMWNPDLPMKPLLDDFFAGYYGKGAPFVRAYFEKLHRIQREYSSSPDHPLRVFDSEAIPSLTDEFLAEAAEMWRKATDAVKDDPATSYNVRMGAFSVDYVRMERGCKLLNLSRSDAGILSSEETQALARSLVARLDEAKDIRIAESPRQNVKQCWRDVAQAFSRPPRADRGELEERFLGIMNPGTWGEFVDDPKADDGKALKLFNTHYTWCVQFPLSRIAFEPGVKYRLRLRVRVDSRRYGMAFSAGIYSTDDRTSAGSAKFTTAQTSNEYAWYDIATWEPRLGEILWIAPGTFGDDGKSSVNGVYIDKVEFIRCLPPDRLSK